MAKFTNDRALDALLNEIATATRVIVTTVQPTDLASAEANALSETTMAPGDFVNSDGTPSGRKVDVAQKVNVPVVTTGNATHVALVDSTDVLAVTTVVPAQVLTQGNTITIPTWSVTVTDPS